MSEQSPDPVTAALARALAEASKIGDWAAVAELARELEARRQPAGAAGERPPAGVIDITSARHRRS